MGQTLTHGVYLPDEGERNCYNGLASNWSILDGAVGTIAEHTTQIAGKAGLSTNNTFSGENIFSKTITVERSTDTGGFIVAKNTTAELGSLPSRDKSLTWAFKDKNNDDLCYARVYYETTGGNSFRIFVRNKYTSGAPSTSGTADYTYFGLKINADKSKEAVFRASLRPYDSTNAYNLGDSTHQWKTLNGVNPGALSLPSNIGYDPIDTRNWDLTGNVSNPNYYTPTVDGWLCVIALAGTMTDAWLDVWVNSLWGQSVSQSPSGELFCMIPVRANLTVRIRVKASSIYDARLIVASGNV